MSYQPFKRICPWGTLRPLMAVSRPPSIFTHWQFLVTKLPFTLKHTIRISNGCLPVFGIRHDGPLSFSPTDAFGSVADSKARKLSGRLWSWSGQFDGKPQKPSINGRIRLEAVVQIF